MRRDTARARSRQGKRRLAFATRVLLRGLALGALASWRFDPAWAASWSVDAPLGPDPIDVPAGVALRLVVDDPSTLTVRTVEGDEVALRGLPDGLLVPAEGRGRRIVVTAPAGAAVRVARSDGPGEVAAWEAWEMEAARALRTGATLPDAPWGGERLLAGLRLRAAAVGDAGTTWLGLVHDVEALRPVEGLHDVGPEVPGSTMHARGPGLVLVRTQPPPGTLARYDVVVTVDGVARPAVPTASTGTVPLATRVWIPPGAHDVSVTTAGADCAITLQEARVRPYLLGPGFGSAATGVAAAERAWLVGDVEAARAGFAPFAEAEGPAGELARARLVELVPEADAARALARWRDASPDGREVLVAAMLARPSLFSPEELLAAALAAADPDPERLARWLDDLGGLRPRGVGILEGMSPDVPFGPSPAAKAIREAALATRWTRLDPDADAVLSPRVGESGPGVARVRVTPGLPATVDLPPRPGGRFPVLRLSAPGPVRYAVDGVARESVTGGALDVALPPGPHAVVVTAGELLVLDADRASGGTRVYAWQAAALPATWTLPDPGVAALLRVDTDGPVLAVFDDGRAVEARPTDGRAEIVAGPHARRVLLLGPEGSHASVAMRGVLGPLPPPDDPALPDEASALARLTALTHAVDDGDAAARLDRARLLGQLALLGPARRDLAALFASGDDRLVASARELALAVTPDVPSAPAPGPRTLAAALPAPPDAPSPTELEALARAAREPFLDALAAEAWLAAGHVPEAWLAAERAGPAGADVRGALDARLAWDPLTRADRSAGLVAVTLAPRPEADPLWARARDAMLAAPWPAAETETIRGPTRDLVKFEGERVEVALFCRDEDGPGEPCAIPVRFDAERRDVEAADGRAVTLSFAGAAGPHELEIGGPGRGQALVVRATVDGALLPPRAERLAVRAAPGRPIELDVATPAMLRVEVVRGAVAVDGRDVAGDTVLALPGEGKARVRIDGDGDVLLSRGELRDPGPPVVLPPAPDPPLLVPGLALEPLLARFSTPASPPRDVPGDHGTLALSLGQYHELLSAPVEPWDATELEAAYGKVADVGFLWADAWARGPGWASGADVEVGRAWTGGWASATLAGGYGTGVVGDGGSLSLALRARHDLAIDPRDALRVGAKLRGGYWSPEAPTPIDPRAWTRWGWQHPVTLAVDAAWVTDPARDLRAELGGRVTSNTGPSIDNVGGWADGDLLVGRWMVLSPHVGLRWRFADEDRSTASLWTEATLSAEAWRWVTPRHRLSFWAGGGYVQHGVEARAGLTMLFTEGRGLHDLPPGTTPFRTMGAWP